MKMISYVGKDAVALLADASLEVEGEIMAADHDPAPKALLERLHVRLNTREVQSLDVGQQQGGDGRPIQQTGDSKK